MDSSNGSRTDELLIICSEMIGGWLKTLKFSGGWMYIIVSSVVVLRVHRCGRAAG